VLAKAFRRGKKGKGEKKGGSNRPCDSFQSGRKKGGRPASAAFLIPVDEWSRLLPSSVEGGREGEETLVRGRGQRPPRAKQPEEEKREGRDLAGPKRPREGIDRLPERRKGGRGGGGLLCPQGGRGNNSSVTTIALYPKKKKGKGKEEGKRGK